jgi:hypothetical protein
MAWSRSVFAPRYGTTVTGDRCYHYEVVPVDLALTGEVVAKLCTNCWEQLPRDWSWEAADLRMEWIRG